jgi:hypothetical protein
MEGQLSTCLDLYIINFNAPSSLNPARRNERSFIVIIYLQKKTHLTRDNSLGNTQFPIT